MRFFHGEGKVNSLDLNGQLWMKPQMMGKEKKKLVPKTRQLCQPNLKHLKLALRGRLSHLITCTLHLKAISFFSVFR